MTKKDLRVDDLVLHSGRGPEKVYRVVSLRSEDEDCVHVMLHAGPVTDPLDQREWQAHPRFLNLVDTYGIDVGPDEGA